MGVMLAAGVAAVGSGLSFMGASKAAKAVKKATKKGIKDEQNLYNKWSGELDGMISKKGDLLNDLGGIFDRFESTGAFGDTDTLANLRKAQSDFSALAAGDFTGFEQQLKKTLSDSLVSTVGSGSPIGAYAGLAADAQMNYRLQGLQTSMGVSEFLGNQANQLLGFEFGLMDQQFEVGYNMEKNKVANVNAMRMQAAPQAGANLQAAGGFVSALGGMIGNYASYRDGLSQQANNNAFSTNQLSAMERMSMANRPQVQQQQLTEIPTSLFSAASTSYNPRSSIGATMYPDLPLTFPDDIPIGEGVLPVRNDIPQQASSRYSYPPYSMPTVPRNLYADSLTPTFNIFQ